MLMQKESGPARPELETAVLGGGCFWCLEPVFKGLRGAHEVLSGYAGGRQPNPTYQLVCTGTSGHAEVVQVKFDPREISFAVLLDVFFSLHDPTTLNRQGNDVGTQYRSGIYVTSPEQRRAAEASKKAYQKALKTRGLGAITTEILDAPAFYFAEDYHQQYLAKNPAGYCGLGGTGVACPVGAVAAE